MTYKGISGFRRNKNLVDLRDVHPAAVHPRYGDDYKSYVVFGIKARQGEAQTVKKGETYYKVIRGGYSRTNLLYGDDGRTYLMLDGACYRTPVQR